MACPRFVCFSSLRSAQGQLLRHFSRFRPRETTRWQVGLVWLSSAKGQKERISDVKHVDAKSSSEPRSGFYLGLSLVDIFSRRYNI